MSDPTAEPGAPADVSSNIPPAGEKSLTAEAQRRVPNKLVAMAATPDRILLRLNKLLAAPGGLSTFLSTFNYTLYILTYASAKSAPLQAKLYQLFTRSPTTTAVDATTQLAALGGLLSSTRTTLRLFGLFPLYAWLRQLMQGPKPGDDSVLYSTQLTQCLLAAHELVATLAPAGLERESAHGEYLPLVLPRMARRGAV
ncbi:hypothetical protein D0863_09695 [Hortaea werneckii]|uniref:Uncharacterized protein n=1 Tax=Hortaea werneckii TaxID=91943 RepID=A0A3M7DJV3_HORWE|nr:hypothetical protein D0863_09695 [Hortaea werneckii]